MCKTFSLNLQGSFTFFVNTSAGGECGPLDTQTVHSVTTKVWDLMITPLYKVCLRLCPWTKHFTMNLVYSVNTLGMQQHILAHYFHVEMYLRERKWERVRGGEAFLGEDSWLQLSEINTNNLIGIEQDLLVPFVITLTELMVCHMSTFTSSPLWSAVLYLLFVAKQQCIIILYMYRPSAQW